MVIKRSKFYASTPTAGVRDKRTKIMSQMLSAKVGSIGSGQCQRHVTMTTVTALRWWCQVVCQLRWERVRAERHQIGKCVVVIPSSAIPRDLVPHLHQPSCCPPSPHPHPSHPLPSPLPPSVSCILRRLFAGWLLLTYRVTLTWLWFGYCQ